MNYNKDIKLNQIFLKIREKGQLTGEISSLLIEKYGDKFFKALDLVNSRKVRKVIFHPSGIERWIVTGVHMDYLVIPRIYCQCDDFYLSVVIRKTTDACYHLIAQTLAEALGNFEEIILDDVEYMDFMKKFHEI